MTGILRHLLYPGRNPIPHILPGSELYTPAIAALGYKSGFLRIKIPDRLLRRSRIRREGLFLDKTVHDDKPLPVIQWIYGLMVNP